MPRKIKGNRYRSATGVEGVAVNVYRSPSLMWSMATPDDPVVIIQDQAGIQSAVKLSKLTPCPAVPMRR